MKRYIIIQGTDWRVIDCLIVSEWTEEGMETMLIITDANLNREREMEGKENTYVRLGEKKRHAGFNAV